MSLKIDHWIPAYNEQVNVNALSQCLRDMVGCVESGINYRFRAGHSCDLVWMRNACLDKSIQDGYDFLLMQDADVFSEEPGGPLKKLLATAQATGATVTGACVSMRTDPPRANVWPCHPGEVFEADKIGTGMVLIDLNKMREWYGEYQGPCFQRTYRTDKGVEQHVGLDIFFSYVVRQHGGLIVCDATVQTTHVNGCHRLSYDGKQAPDATVIADTADEAA